VVAGRGGAAPSSLGIDAYEHEPTCTQSSGPTECAGMIRCDTRIWGDAAQSVIGQSRTARLGGNTGASAMPSTLLIGRKLPSAVSYRRQSVGLPISWPGLHGADFDLPGCLSGAKCRRIAWVGVSPSRSAVAAVPTAAVHPKTAALHPKMSRVMVGVMVIAPSIAVSVAVAAVAAVAVAAAAHPDTALRCPPPAGATVRVAAVPVTTVAVAPMVVMPMVVMRPAEFCETIAVHPTETTAVHPTTAVHSATTAAVPTAATAVGRRTQRRAAHGNRHCGYSNRYLTKRHDAHPCLTFEHPSLLRIKLVTCD
jgi:hypothetical protein